jgi:hypothetical protein
LMAEVDYLCYPSRGGTDGSRATYYYCYYYGSRFEVESYRHW